MRTKETERLDDASIERVIQHLENKGTKKDACSILNISYNTTRLGTIIDKYLERKKQEAERRAEKRGKPATSAEISYAISSYLEGKAIEVIGDTLYRSASFVRNILDRNAVPMRNIPHSYFKPQLIPEEAVRETFSLNEKVYSTRYDSLAQIKSEFKPGVYLVYLLSDKQQQFAYQPAEELASLEHLRKLGVNV